MIVRLRSILAAPQWLLPGLAALLLAALALRGHGAPQESDHPAPERLPENPAVALVDREEGFSVTSAAHIESAGGQLGFGPPPLSGGAPSPAPSASSVKAAPPANVSLIDKMSDQFDPGAKVRPQATSPRLPEASNRVGNVQGPAASRPVAAPAQRTQKVVPKQPAAQQPFVPPVVTLPAAPSSVATTPVQRTQQAVPVVPQQPAAQRSLTPPVVTLPTVSMPTVSQPAPVMRRLPVPQPEPSSSLTDVASRPVEDRYASAVRQPVPPNVQSEPTPRAADAVFRTPEVPRTPALRQPASSAVSRHSTEWQRQMGPVAQRADMQIREAFETCGRGALFAGRSEMIQALQLIAQNADALEQGNEHSDALAAGMRAMAEAESFAPRGSRLESELDMEKLVASHRTPVVREALAGAERGRKLTALEAQNRYYTYAQQQLAEAAAGLPVGAVALYGLGKIHATLATADSDSRALEEPQAMTLFQAALIADPGNPLAAHELGVLLARYQRYDDALAMLQHSAQIASLPETWRNLAVVHTKRGEADMAKRASQEAQNAQARLNAAKPASHPALARGSVRWLSPDQFAQTRQGDSNLRPTTEAKTAPPATTAATAAEQPSGVFSWLPWRTVK